MKILCKICDIGSLEERKKYRMSGPVVFIGYVLLIPSVLGVLACAFLFFSTAALGGASNSNGVTLASGIFLFAGIAAFVGGLLGWLLVMKKRVLMCDACKSTVNAS